MESKAPRFLETVFGSFLSTRLHMRLEGNPAEYFSEEISVRAGATTIHETMHLFQTVLTGYGHIAWDSHRQLTAYLLDEWRRLGEQPNGRRRLPLAHCSDLSHGHTKESFLALETARDWLLIVAARFWLRTPGAYA